MGFPRLVEWVDIFFSRMCSWTRNWTCISFTGRWSLLPLTHQGSLSISLSLCIYEAPDGFLLLETEIYSDILRNWRCFRKMWMKIKKSEMVMMYLGFMENLEKSAPPDFKKEHIEWARCLPVSVSIQAAITNYLRPLGLTGEIYFSVLEAGSLRPGCHHRSVLVRTLFWIADDWLLLVSSHGRKRERNSLVSFSYKGTNPFNERHALIAELPPKVPSS